MPKVMAGHGVFTSALTVERTNVADMREAEFKLRSFEDATAIFEFLRVTLPGGTWDSLKVKFEQYPDRTRLA